MRAQNVSLTDVGILHLLQLLGLEFLSRVCLFLHLHIFLKKNFTVRYVATFYFRLINNLGFVACKNILPRLFQNCCIMKGNVFAAEI